MATTIYHHETMRTARGLIVAAVLLALLAVVATPVLVQLGGAALGWALLLVVAAFACFIIAGTHAGDAGLYFDVTTRRTFRAVCHRKGLSRPDGNGGTVYPRFGRLIGNAQHWQAVIVPLTGQSLADYGKAAEAFGMAYGSLGVRFSDNGDGTLTMRAGYQPLESRTATVAGSDHAPEAGADWRELLSALDVAVTRGGGAYRMPAIDTHILTAGITGAGKGSVIWSLLLGLVPGIRAGVVRVWGFDPKRMELSIGRQFFGDRYANTDETMIALLERARDEMMVRADEFAGKIRRFVPSPAYPLNVLVIDELAYLSALIQDRKLKERAEKALSTILILGRASGFVVVAAVQDPRKETVSFRDLFPTRIGMKLPAAMIDLTLGPGSRELGAACDEIPRGKAGAGMAFVISEASDLPEAVRFTWCSDELIQETAATLDAV